MVRDALLTYGAPFLGAILLSVGLAGGVLGGYSSIQREAGLCSDPILTVSTAAQTQERLASHQGNSLTFSTIEFANLSDAEQEAFEEALQSFRREGEINGTLQHRRAFRRGVVVNYEGAGYYTALASRNSCLTVSPLLLPMGLVSILLGVAGVLTPPVYRRYAAFERRQQ